MAHSSRIEGMLGSGCTCYPSRREGFLKRDSVANGIAAFRPPVRTAGAREVVGNKFSSEPSLGPGFGMLIASLLYRHLYPLPFMPLPAQSSGEEPATQINIL